MRISPWLIALLLFAAPAVSAASTEVSYLLFGQKAGPASVSVKCEAKSGCGPFTIFVRDFTQKVVAKQPFPSGIKKGAVATVSFKVPAGTDARFVPLKTYLVTVESNARTPGKFVVADKESSRFSMKRSANLRWINTRSEPGRNPNPPPDPDETWRFNGRAYNL